MANDYVLAEAIQLIKAGKKEAARVMLERYLQRNPDNIQAWMWEAETFPNDADKIKALEACLRKNPGNAQVIQALNLLKSRAAPPPASKPVSPFTVSPFEDASASSSSASAFSLNETPPLPPPPAKKPLPFVTDSAPAAPSVSPFTTTSPFLSEEPETGPQAQKPPLAVDVAPADFQSEPTAKPNKPARKMSKTAQIAAMVGAPLVFLLLIGGYVGAGFYLDGQINAAFAARQCEAVARRASFILLYPQSVFSFLFDGYDQYAQCSLKLEAERFSAAQDWANALFSAQHYAALYPQGVFSDEMREQAVAALSNWAKQLLESKNYADGIEKSKQFIETYPAHSSNEAMRDGILQAYLNWSKELADKKQYSAAQGYLSEALAYFETDAARAAKVKEELVKTYVAWGDEQAAINNMENAAQYYRLAGELSQGGLDAELLIAKAYLKQALEIADKNDFNRALTKAAEVESSAQAENIKAEAAAARGEILLKYSASNSIQAMEQMQLAVPAMCGGQKPVLPIFGLDENAIRAALFSAVIIPLPADVSAVTPGQLRYVACAEDVEKEIASCAYPAGVLYRLRYDWQVSLYDIKTGAVVASQELRGGAPPECNKKETFPKGVKVKKSYGAKPTAEDVAEWLRTLGLLK